MSGRGRWVLGGLGEGRPERVCVHGPAFTDWARGHRVQKFPGRAVLIVPHGAGFVRGAIPCGYLPGRWLRLRANMPRAVLWTSVLLVTVTAPL